MQYLDNILFVNGFIHDDASKVESLQIDGAVFAVDNVLHDRSADGRSLLDAVPAETGGEDDVAVVRMRSDDGVLIQCVVIVIAGPGTLQLFPMVNDKALIGIN